LIISSLGPGGAERQVVNLANGLVEHSVNNDTYLLCTHLSRVDQDRFYLDQLDERVDVREYYQRDTVLDPMQIPALRPYADLLKHIQPFSRQLLMLHLATALLEIKPDVVHGWLDETFINTALVCHMLGIPCVVGRWGSMPPGVNRTISERDQSNIDYLNHAYREISRLPGLRLTSNSRQTGDAYARLMQVSKDDVRIVYNGIDESALMTQATEVEAIRESLRIPKHAKVVGTVFRMTEEKRPLLWVEVAARLAEQHPDMHFVIVGAGPMECQIRELAAALGLQNLHMPGKQTRIGGWFALFDVMLLTSRVEGVSNAVVESQFCQCPVVAPNVGGLSEAMSHQVSGLLLEDHSVESFASAVTSIIEDPAYLRQLGDGASEFARSKFSVPTMVANYSAIFE
jgi:glycosyltransferase involved in cell wall biosynthesis